MAVFIFLVVLSVFAVVPADYLQKKREQKKKEEILAEDAEIAIS